MAKTQTSEQNTAPTQMPGLGELSVIRNILMGQQIAETDERFGMLDERLEKENAEHEAIRQQMLADFAQRLTSLEQNFTSKLNDLEAAHQKTTAELNSKMEATSRADKAKIGQLLIELGQKLVWVYCCHSERSEESGVKFQIGFFASLRMTIYFL